MAESSALVAFKRLLVAQIVVALILIQTTQSLRCRSDDGPSEAELKRVARTCMRKFGENAYNMQSNQQQQEQQQQSQGRYNQRTNRNGYNNYPDYDDSEENSEGDNENVHQYSARNYHNNNDRGSSSGNTNTNGGNGSGHGGAYNDDDDRFVNQRNRQRSNNHNKSNANGNGNGSGNSPNQRNQGANTQNGRSANNNNNNNNRNKNNNSNSNSNNNNNNNNNSSSDSACIVQCFFEEMNMLNNNNYPDRHKVLYILTKDMRDRELRSFYTDTIQECFRYLESQRRRDKCQFSRDLISCMTEYAKGNCDDWNEFSMMFN